LAAARGVVSSLKSAAVGGGTLAGSGIGMAALMSMAGALAVLAGVSDGSAKAGAPATARKVAATAISTRSYPKRSLTGPRILNSSWWAAANAPALHHGCV